MNQSLVAAVALLVLLVDTTTTTTAQPSPRWDGGGGGANNIIKKPPLSGREGLRYLSASSFAERNDEQQQQQQQPNQQEDQNNNNNDEYTEEEGGGFRQSWRPDDSPPARRPPPPPPPFSSGQQQQHQHQPQQKYNPIHYNFENLEQKKQKRQYDDDRRTGTSGGGSRDNNKNAAKNEDEEDGGILLPQTYYQAEAAAASEQQRNLPLLDDKNDDKKNNNNNLPRFASPRRDAITVQMSTRRGRVTLCLATTVTGALLGCAVSKLVWNTTNNSQNNNNNNWAMLLFMGGGAAAVFWVAFWLRNPYGELVRSLGLTLLWTTSRYQGAVRRKYPIHIMAAVGAAPRRPFPPSNNIWTYQPENDNVDDDDDDDVVDNNYRRRPAQQRRRGPPPVDFNMLYSMIAMAFVGSACGSSLPVLPTWLGALLGASALGYSTTLASARGDLARCMGMRAVSTARLIWQINRELQVLRKTAVVSGLVLDKILILDRKHRIKERIITSVSFLYDQAVKTTAAARQVKNDQQQQESGGNGRGGRERATPANSTSRGRGPENRRDEYDRRARREDYAMPHRDRRDDRFDGTSSRPRVARDNERDDLYVKRRELWEDKEDEEDRARRLKEEEENERKSRPSSSWWGR